MQTFGVHLVLLELGQILIRKENNMKKLLLTIAIVLLATPCMAWTLSWDSAGAGIAGYEVTYGPSPLSGGTANDVGVATSIDLDSLGLAVGTRYEFYVRAYDSATPHNFSTESDHIRWTYPEPPVVIEMMGAPVNITINP